MALARLLLNEVASEMAYLYTIIPIELLLVDKYFDDIYVSVTSDTNVSSNYGKCIRYHIEWWLIEQITFAKGGIIILIRLSLV